MEPPPVKLLLDTDIGSDIDDALALAYLLAQPRCELLGITTVSGEPAVRAALASALCRAASRDVPIYPGTAAPLLVAQRQASVGQAAALDHLPHQTVFPEGEAIDFLQRTIRAHPGEVTLLAIGPLTNVALLLTLDPAIPTLLGGLTLMLGWFTDRPPHPDQGDWNALCDPHAAAIVCRAPVPATTIVPLDVTRRLLLPAAQAWPSGVGSALATMEALATVDPDPADPVVFHDPLAAATIFEPDLCTYTRGTVTIDTCTAATQGMSRFALGDGPHRVAVTVDPTRFFDLYWAATGTTSEAMGPRMCAQERD
ncbi:MAG: nucleoside hydrolase [Chloroflexi bacterium]|nr:nucleoside hydrolase [Chloroflexota bacterium]